MKHLIVLVGLMSDPKTNSGIDLSLEGETLAYTSADRSRKADKQTRDRFGRWIAAGASVRWKMDGQEWAGTVKRIEDGIAVVSVTRGDGTETEAHIEPTSLRVLASKATLPPNKNRFYDPDNNFANKLATDEVQNAITDSGHAAIERQDGYMLDIFEKKPKDDGNPIMYQLFVPGGASLGKYGQDAVASFDAMVSDHQSSSAPAAPAGVGGGVVASGEEKPFRVPENVKSGIASALSESHSSLSAEDLSVATRLANDSTVSLSDVKWVHSFFASTDLEERVRGGFKGKKWSTKIISPSEEEPDDEVETNLYDFDDETFDYFATSQDEGSGSVHGLIAVDYESGAVYDWSVGFGFEILPDAQIEDVDYPEITPVDEMSAEEIAKRLDSGETSFDVIDLVPEERNLFSLAEAEMDWEEIDRTVSIIAAASDGEYTPIERSVNAKQQRRGAGGKFGSGGGSQPEPDTQVQGAVVKAQLPVELPLVEDIPARINEWVASEATEAPVMAAATPEDEPEAEAAPESYPAEEQAIEDGPTGPKGEAVYFAVVDDVNKQAVMEAIAIVKQDGQPQAYLRQQGQWASSPDTLTILMGATPPPVVELAEPSLVKDVLAQIDTHDKEQGSEEAPIAASAGYYAMPDGSLAIFSVADLTQAVTASLESADTFVKAHIRSRARALNRMDVVPEDWRTPSLTEIGEISANEAVYGEFGEVLTAAGSRGKGGNAASLRAYWTTGKGSGRIRWSTPGDLTRAHKILEKYVPGRGWALAQSYHQYLFGVANRTRDTAAGMPPKNSRGR